MGARVMIFLHYSIFNDSIFRHLYNGSSEATDVKPMLVFNLTYVQVHQFCMASDTLDVFQISVSFQI